MRVSVNPEQIRSVFNRVKDDRSFDESRGLVEQGKMPAEMIQAMALRPELLRAFGGFGNCVYPGGLLERSIKEFVIIEASRANACQFCAESHIALTKALGLSNDPLGDLDDEAGHQPRERLAIEYTRAAMADSNHISESLFRSLREHFSEPEIVELTFLIGFINMLNLFNNCLQVRYNGEYAAIDAKRC